MSDVTAQPAAGRRTLTVGDLVMVPIRRWPVVIVCALLGLAAGVAYFALVPPSYTATSVVVVRPVVADPFTYPGAGADRSVNMNVENGIATGTEVVSAVATATGQQSDTARESLKVEVPVGAQILRFNYTDRNESTAIDGANAAATSYLSVRERMYRDQRAGLLDSYDEAIETATKQEQDARKALPTGSSSTGVLSPSLQAAITRVQALNEQLTQLVAARARLAAVDVSPGTVSRTAAPPVPSSRGNAVLLLGVALLGGLLAGIVLAFVRESVDRRVRSASDTAEALGIPALAEIRRRHGVDSGADMRYAALAVTSRLSGPGPHRLVVLSARADEGRTAFYQKLVATLEAQGHAVRRGMPVPQAPEPPPAADTAPVAIHVPDPPDGDRVPVVPYPLSDAAASETTLVLSLGQSPRQVDDNGAAEAERRSSSVAVEMSPVVPVNGTTHGPRVGTGQSAVAFNDDALTLVDAAPAEADEQGVRDARGAAALVLVARDRTRIREVQRLVERLRVNGVEPLGFVVVPRRG